jgi:hypothetical protein
MVFTHKLIRNCIRCKIKRALQIADVFDKEILKLNVIINKPILQITIDTSTSESNIQYM